MNSCKGASASCTAVEKATHVSAWVQRRRIVKRRSLCPARQHKRCRRPLAGASPLRHTTRPLLLLLGIPAPLGPAEHLLAARCLNSVAGCHQLFCSKARPTCCRPQLHKPAGLWVPVNGLDHLAAVPLQEEGGGDRPGADAHRHGAAGADPQEEV